MLEGPLEADVTLKQRRLLIQGHFKCKRQAVTLFFSFRSVKVIFLLNRGAADAHHQRDIEALDRKSGYFIGPAAGNGTKTSLSLLHHSVMFRE